MMLLLLFQETVRVASLGQGCCRGESSGGRRRRLPGCSPPGELVFGNASSVWCHGPAVGLLLSAVVSTTLLTFPGGGSTFAPCGDFLHNELR